MKSSNDNVLTWYYELVNSFEIYFFKKTSKPHLIEAWEYSRFAVRTSILRSFGGTSAGNTNKNQSYYKKLIHMFPSNFTFSPTTEDVIFDHPRGSGLHSDYLDGYLKSICGPHPLIFRDKEGKQPFFLNVFLLTHTLLPTRLNRFYLLHLEILQFITRFCFFTPEIISYFHKFEQHIENKTQKKLSLKKVALKTFLSFGIKEIICRYFLRFCQAKRVAMVTSYTKPFVTKAASSIGIEVYEVQHGAITRHHEGYEGAERLKYFPKNIVLWGELWKHSFQEPDFFNFLVLGCDSFYRSCRIAYETPKKDKIVFLGVFDHSKRMEEFMEKIYPEARRQGIDVVLKIHPNDNIEKYKHLKSRVSNKNLYQEICDARWVIGTGASTAMYEAMASGCCVGLFRDFGHEAFKWILEFYGEMEIIDSNSDLKVALQKTKFIHSSPEDFFKGQDLHKD